MSRLHCSILFALLTVAVGMLRYERSPFASSDRGPGVHVDLQNCATHMRGMRLQRSPTLWRSIVQGDDVQWVRAYGLEQGGERSLSMAPLTDSYGAGTGLQLLHVKLQT